MGSLTGHHSRFAERHGRAIRYQTDVARFAALEDPLDPRGWAEISAVRTDAAYRGQGLATRLVRAVAAGIRERGETPFLLTSAANANAIRLYESIGFTLRRRSVFTVLRVPESTQR